MEHKTRCCDDCKAVCKADFREVANLKNVAIYVHEKKEKQVLSKQGETYIIHNKSSYEVKRPEYVGELCQYRTKCFQCTRIIQKVRDLLDDFGAIRGNQVLGICKNCKKSNTTKNCKRCEFIVNKYLADKVLQLEEQQRCLEIWLYQVKKFLQGLSEEGDICKYEINQDKGSKKELETLLQQLKEPLFNSELIAKMLPHVTDKASLVFFRESKDMIDKVIMKLKSQESVLRFNKPYFSDETIYPSPSKSAMCISKYIAGKKIAKTTGIDNSKQLPREPAVETLSKVKNTPIISPISVGDLKQRKPDITEKYSKIKEKTKQKSLVKGAKSTEYLFIDDNEKTGQSKEIDTEREQKEKKKQKSKEVKRRKLLETDIIILMKNFKLQKSLNVQKKSPKQKILTLKQLSPLPIIKRRRPATSEELEIDSATTMECDVTNTVPKEIIKHTSVIAYNRHSKEKKSAQLPMLFQIQAECPDVDNKLPVFGAYDTSDNKVLKKTLNEDDFSDIGGIMSYRLSNREFIENGITRLPSMKIMRRMNIFRMEMAHISWFERHKSVTKQYDTEQVFAIVDDNGFGKWFYRNGTVALEYYAEEEPSTVCRYIVYSCIENQETKTPAYQAVLAAIDSLGNGVVYDHNGNVRLKYNQSEGLVIDEKIGPPGRWMWHALNEPPVLQKVFVESLLKKPNTCLDDLSPTPSLPIAPNPPAIPSIEQEARAKMLGIEFDNFVKERAHKALQKFRPFEIKSKAAKLNNYFSLKILDQGNIRLVYRNGPTCVTLNIGMLLKSNEIIDTESAEVSEVATPYDRRPARSKGLAEIQHLVDKARKLAKRNSYK